MLSAGLVGLWTQAPLDARLTMAGLVLMPVLAIMAWFVRVPVRRRIVWAVGCLGAGAALLAVAVGPARAGRLATALGPWFGLLPCALVLLPVARRLRPFIASVVALILFLVAGTLVQSAVARGMGVDIPSALRTVRAWLIAVGVLNTAIGVLVFGWLLRRRSRRLLLVALVVAAAAGVAAHARLGVPDVIVVVPVGIVSNVLQVLLVWLMLKGFVLLGERHLLPSEILHSHFCWALLTFYFFAWSGSRNLWGDPRWLRSSLMVALGVQVVLLHVLFRRMWSRPSGQPGLRLLLLRVFGRGDARERLLEWLDDTWRRIGRVDLIAGSDLALRTMAATMLEAFLLRQVDGQFVKSTAELDRRLERLRSGLEGDARHPVNSVNCYDNVWEVAVDRLARGADVVLMDLRGLTRRNEGCLLELAYVVRRVPLPRVLLLVDRTTDAGVLEETTDASWNTLPEDSPNSRDPDPVLNVVDLSERTGDPQGAVFGALLRAAFRSRPAT